GVDLSAHEPEGVVEEGAGCVVAPGDGGDGVGDIAEVDAVLELEVGKEPPSGARVVELPEEAVDATLVKRDAEVLAGGVLDAVRLIQDDMVMDREEADGALAEG